MNDTPLNTSSHGTDKCSAERQNLNKHIHTVYCTFTHNTTQHNTTQHNTTQHTTKAKPAAAVARRTIVVSSSPSPANLHSGDCRFSAKSKSSTTAAPNKVQFSRYRPLSSMAADATRRKPDNGGKMDHQILNWDWGSNILYLLIQFSPFPIKHTGSVLFFFFWCFVLLSLVLLRVLLHRTVAAVL